VASLIIPIYFYLSFIQAKKQEGVRIGIHDLKENRAQGMLSAFSAIRVVKSFARERYEVQRNQEFTDKLAEKEIGHHRTNRYFDGWKLFVDELGAAAIVLFTSYLILNGQMSVGAIMLHLLLFRNVSSPIRHLHRIYDEHNEAVVAAYGYFNLLNAKRTESTIDRFTPALDEWQRPFSLKMEGVFFGYDPDVLVLKDINLELKAGKTTALVGLSGAGKTTIASLLVRFFDPMEGKILINNINIKDIPLQFLRNQVGMVLQDNFIFDGSIAQNIQYGNLNATDDEIINASKKAALHDFVLSLPKGYETSAHRLAGGQKQRVALARVFLKNPPLLVLDEPTASLDAITAEQIKKALDEVQEGRTTLVISHNISQIIVADEIIVIKDGEIVESGNHESLYKMGGHYRTIINSNIENMNLLKLMGSLKLAA